MHVLITGGSGFVGRFLSDRLHKDGHQLTFLGRKPADWLEAGFQPWDLSDLNMALARSGRANPLRVFSCSGQIPGR